MKIQIENLAAQMRGVELNNYQKALALDEYYKLLDYVAELEQLRQQPVSGSACDLLRRLKEANMCSVIGDELIDDFLQAQADR